LVLTAVAWVAAGPLLQCVERARRANRRIHLNGKSATRR